MQHSPRLARQPLRRATDLISTVKFHNLDVQHARRRKVSLRSVHPSIYPLLPAMSIHATSHHTVAATVVAGQVAMEAELVAITRQVGLLKEGYSKARDNLRAEQSVREPSTPFSYLIGRIFGGLALHREEPYTSWRDASFSPRSRLARAWGGCKRGL